MTAAFLGALGYCLVMRVIELRVSADHEARVIAAGGHRVRPDGTGALVAVHTGWFVAMLVEQFVIGPTALPGALVWISPDCVDYGIADGEVLGLPEEPAQRAGQNEF